MSIELKIKAKHLALEPGIIRHEEEKLQKQIDWHRKNDKDSGALIMQLWQLRNHRKNEVRNESRATNLARVYLAGKPYSFAEKKRKVDNEFTFDHLVIPRIAAMAKKYGPWQQRSTDDKVMQDKIREWSKI